MVCLLVCLNQMQRFLLFISTRLDIFLQSGAAQSDWPNNTLFSNRVKAVL